MRTTRLLGFSLLSVTAALVPFSARAYLATGGDSTSHFDQYALHTFTTPGTNTFTTTRAMTVDLLLVGGGGSGGHIGGAGGGAGQVVIQEGVQLDANTTYTVIVGAGGFNDTYYYMWEYNVIPGANGGDSSFGMVVDDVFSGTTALGGGGGGSWGKEKGGASANSGGSSVWGGRIASILAEGGHAGAASSGAALGGGAGAGGDAVDCPVYDGPSGNGGPGVTVNFTGVPMVLGGGGGGGSGGSKSSAGLGGSGIGGNGSAYNSGEPGGDGLDGTGSGGGGGSRDILTLGGKGGDGIVIVRYADEFTEGNDPILGTPQVADVACATANASLYVISAGLGETSCDVFFAYGALADRLTETNFLAAAAAGTRVSAPIVGLSPNHTYYGRYFAENALGGVAETEVFLFQTPTEPTSSNANPYAGLIQARYGEEGVDYSFDFDIRATEGTTRTPGIVMANVNQNGSYTNPYDGLDYAWPLVWNDPPKTFAYDGYIYLDASLTYTFGVYLDDFCYLYIDDVQFFNRVGGWTTKDYVPESTGWHSLRIYIPGGYYDKGTRGKTGATTTWDDTLGFAYRTDGGTAALPMSGWHPVVDDGSGQFLCTTLGFRTVTLDSWTLADGELDASLSFGVYGGLDATLVACYGSTWGGDDLTAWENAEDLGTIASADSSYTVSGLAIPSTARYVRFALRFPAASSMVAAWSETAALADAAQPAFTEGGVSSLGGDFAIIGGAISALGAGASQATVSVEFGPTDGTTSQADVTYGVIGPVSIRLDNLTPATEYTYRVIVSNDRGGVVATLPQTFTTLAASTLGPSVSATLNQQTVTLAGTLTQLGAGTTTVYLLLGPDADHLETVDCKVATEAGLITFEERVCYSNQYAFAMVSSNACAGLVWDSATNLGTFDVIDKTTYYWYPGEGDWNAPASWWAYQTPEPVGYPSYGAAAEFQKQATSSVVRITQPEYVNSIAFSGGEHEILFVSTTSNTVLRCNTQNNWNGHVYVTFDNVGFRDDGDFFLGDCASMVFTNSADGYIGKLNGGNSNIVYAVTGHSSLTVGGEFNMGGPEATYLIDDSILTVLGNASFQTQTTVPPTLRFQGKSPMMRAGGLFQHHEKDRVSAHVVFDIPEEGYDTIPLATLEGNTRRLGDVEWPNSNVPFIVSVDPESRVTRGAKSVNQLLIDWPNGIKTEDFVFGDLPNPDTDYFYWMPADREEGVEPTQLWVHVQATGGCTVILLR